ncbi:hypothetical protein BD311DRAFT_757280 [Dichomitus squalens]|uniref:Uncharacterized protein n=1 Tax=Dichomitus squalens TaxID=114155 RepID=A0A4V2K0I7_9APHY|nr:hypothetical protein BD311DRAFT_757280 [Dichomitus squalens]
MTPAWGVWTVLVRMRGQLTTVRSHHNWLICHPVLLARLLHIVCPRAGIESRVAGLDLARIASADKYTACPSISPYETLAARFTCGCHCAESDQGDEEEEVLEERGSPHRLFSHP